MVVLFCHAFGSPAHWHSGREMFNVEAALRMHCSTSTIPGGDFHIQVF
jgi:hypothetical protein